MGVRFVRNYKTFFFKKKNQDQAAGHFISDVGEGQFIMVEVG